MSLNITYHATGSDDIPRFGGGNIIPVWPAQVGEEVVALDGDSTVRTDTVIARLVADEDCRIAISDDTTAATGTSMKLPAGSVEGILLLIGQTINVIAAA